jgi:hypothetical protein
VALETGVGPAVRCGSLFSQILVAPDALAPSVTLSEGDALGRTT